MPKPTRKHTQKRKRRRHSEPAPSSRRSTARRATNRLPDANRNNRTRNLAPMIWLATAGLIAAGIYFAMDHQRGTATTSNATASELLTEMQTAYQQLTSYSDTTRIQLRAPDGDRWIEEAALIKTQYAQPNQIRFSAERPGTDVVIDIASDGQSLRSQVQDSGTRDFDNQFVMAAAPERMTVPKLYEVTEYTEVSRRGERNSLLMKVPAPLLISQLSLLLRQEGDEQPFGGLLTNAPQERLDDAKFEGSVCHRVALKVEDGAFELWIDSETKLLRRVVFPPPGGEGKLICDYLSIETGPPAAEAFQMQPPAGAQLVRNFVLPPTETRPPALNQKVDAFSFADLNGGEVTADDLAGKLTVLCWFDIRTENQLAIQELQAVADTTKDKDYQFLLVSTDPAGVSRDDIQRVLKSWNVTLDVARDVQAVGRESFGIEHTPALVVIDKEQVVQIHETGIDPQLDEQLPVALGFIAEGNNVAADYLAMLAKREEDYRQELAAAGLNAPQAPAVVAPAAVPPASEPQRVKLKELWTQTTLRQPGNIYATVLPDDRLQILVCEGGQQIAELDSGGKIIKRHTVSKATDSPVQRLRFATDKSRNRFALGFSSGARTATVFNAAWEPVLTYPATPSEKKVAAATLCDLDQDGEVELYAALVETPAQEVAAGSSVHRVELSGETVWTNDEVEPALSIEPWFDASKAGAVLTTNQNGWLSPIGADGSTKSPLKVGEHAIHRLFSSDSGSTSSAFFGVTYLPTGELWGIGIDPGLKDLLRFDIPKGQYVSEIDFATRCDFGESRWWVIAGPDGSVRFVSEDRKFGDLFQTGQMLTGIATYRTRAVKVLLVASESGVTAYQVELPELPKSE